MWRCSQTLHNPQRVSIDGGIYITSPWCNCSNANAISRVELSHSMYPVMNQTCLMQRGSLRMILPPAKDALMDNR